MKLYLCQDCGTLHQVGTSKNEYVLETGFVFVEGKQYHVGYCRYHEKQNTNSEVVPNEHNSY
jgi:hypothetical protein